MSGYKDKKFGTTFGDMAVSDGPNKRRENKKTKEKLKDQERKGLGEFEAGDKGLKLAIDNGIAEVMGVNGNFKAETNGMMSDNLTSTQEVAVDHLIEGADAAEAGALDQLNQVDTELEQEKEKIAKSVEDYLSFFEHKCKDLLAASDPADEELSERNFIEAISFAVEKSGIDAELEEELAEQLEVFYKKLTAEYAVKPDVSSKNHDIKAQEAGKMTNKVEEAQSFKELYEILKEIGSVTTKGQKLSPEEMVVAIESLRRGGSKDTDQITKKYGLRSKVEELLGLEKKKDSLNQEVKTGTQEGLAVREEFSNDFSEYFRNQLAKEDLVLSNDNVQKAFNDSFEKVYEEFMEKNWNKSAYYKSFGWQEAIKISQQLTIPIIESLVSRSKKAKENNTLGNEPTGVKQGNENKVENKTVAKIELRNKQEHDFANFFAKHWRNKLDIADLNATDEDLKEMYRRVFDWSLNEFNLRPITKDARKKGVKPETIDRERAGVIATYVSFDMENKWRKLKPFDLKLEIPPEEAPEQSKTEEENKEVKKPREIFFEPRVVDLDQEEAKDKLEDDKKTEAIAKVKDFEGLYRVLNNIGIIASTGGVFNPDYLKRAVDQVRLNMENVTVVPRANGLRAKVIELLKLEQDKESQENNLPEAVAIPESENKKEKTKTPENVAILESKFASLFMRYWRERLDQLKSDISEEELAKHHQEIVDWILADLDKFTGIKNAKIDQVRANRISGKLSQTIESRWRGNNQAKKGPDNQKSAEPVQPVRNENSDIDYERFSENLGDFELSPSDPSDEEIAELAESVVSSDDVIDGVEQNGGVRELTEEEKAEIKDFLKQTFGDLFIGKLNYDGVAHAIDQQIVNDAFADTWGEVVDLEGFKNNIGLFTLQDAQSLADGIIDRLYPGSTIHVEEVHEADLGFREEAEENIQDAEFTMIEEEFENLSPEEQEEVKMAWRDIGFIMREKKGELLSAAFRKLASDNNPVGRFIGEVANTYSRDADQARDQIESAHQTRSSGGIGGKSWDVAKSGMALVGEATKWGRTVAEITGTGFLLPYRAVMAGTQIVGRGADAGKEMRLSGKEMVKSDGSFAQWIREGLRDDKGKEGLNNDEKEFIDSINGYSDKQIDNLVKQVINENTIIDTAKRLHPEQSDRIINQWDKFRNPKAYYNLTTRLARWNINKSVDKINEKISAIDQSDSLSLIEKRKQKNEILRDYSYCIRDIDRMVDDAGKVDTTSYILKQANRASKVAIFALAAETLAVSAYNIYKLFEDSGSLSEGVPISAKDGSQADKLPLSSPTLAPESPTSSSSPVGETVPTASGTVPEVSPIPATPEAPKINPLDAFKASHALYEKTGAEMTEGANGIKVEYEIGAKGDFNTLDQALRRVVVQEFNVGTDGKFDALEATRAENSLANLRVLLEGKSVGGMNPEELKGIAEFKGGKLTITDYDKFNEFLNDKLFSRAEANITTANVATGYGETSAAKWQEMLDQRGDNAKVDFGTTEQASVAPKAEVTPSPAVESAPKAPVTESVSSVEVKPELNVAPLESIETKTTESISDYLGDTMGKFDDGDPEKLVSTLTEANLDVADWHTIEKVIGPNIDLLRDADGTFSAEQMTKAMELIRPGEVSDAKIRMVLEVMHTMDFKHVNEEKALIAAIVDYKKGSEASIHHLEKIFGVGESRNASVSLNEKKGIMTFSGIGKDKFDGSINFHDGKIKVGKFVGQLFGRKVNLSAIAETVRLMRR